MSTTTDRPMSDKKRAAMEAEAASKARLAALREAEREAERLAALPTPRGLLAEAHAKLAAVRSDLAKFQTGIASVTAAEADAQAAVDAEETALAEAGAAIAAAEVEAHLGDPDAPTRLLEAREAEAAATQALEAATEALAKAARNRQTIEGLETEGQYYRLPEGEKRAKEAAMGVLLAETAHEWVRLMAEGLAVAIPAWRTLKGIERAHQTMNSSVEVRYPWEPGISRKPAMIYGQVPEMPRLLAEVLSRGWPDSDAVGRDKEHAGIDIEAELAKLLRDPAAKLAVE
jgi:hypothetical protein